MLKPLSIKQPEHDLWFLADYHEGHNRNFIYEPRGFKTVEEHDRALQRRWNERLTDHSVIFHLGDLMLTADEERFWTFCRTHRFKHLYIMWGNHCSGQNAAYKRVMKARFPDSVEADGLLYEVYPLSTCVDGNPHRQVTFLPTFVELSVGGQRLSLCHYALAAHHKQGHGAIALSGHSHGNLALTHKDTGRGMRLDVGVESFGRPVSLTEIKEHLRGRPLDVQDHHGRDE